MTDDEVIADSMAQLNVLKAARMSDAQLVANVTTYEGSPEGSANRRWRQVCVAEQERRATTYEFGQDVDVADCVTGEWYTTGTIARDYGPGSPLEVVLAGTSYMTRVRRTDVRVPVTPSA